MSVNQKVVAEFQKKGYVIANGKVLCAQSAIANRYSNLSKVFQKDAWALVTEDEAVKLQGCKDDDGRAWLKFAYIPLERVPHFNTSLPTPEETVEEVVISREHFAKKPVVAAAPARPASVIKTEDLKLPPAEDADQEGNSAAADEESEEATEAAGSDGAGSEGTEGEGNDEAEFDATFKTEGGAEGAATDENPATSIERKELQKKTVPELRKMLKEDLGMSLKGNEKKEELIEMILG